MALHIEKRRRWRVTRPAAVRPGGAPGFGNGVVGHIKIGGLVAATTFRYVRFGGSLRRTLVMALLLVMSVENPVWADEATTEAESPWAFTFEPYLWVAGIDGKLGSDQAPSAAGVTFIDLLESFRGGLMGAASVRYKRVGVVADGNWVRVGKNVPLRFSGVTGLTDVDARADVAFGTVAAFFRFEPTEGLVLDPYLGARWWYIDANLEFNPSGPRVADDTAWADFVAGLMLSYYITERWFIEATGDVGGGSSKVTWQIYGGTGYNLREWVGLSIGYRYIGVDYDKDGFLFDSTLQGLLVGFKFRL